MTGISGCWAHVRGVQLSGHREGAVGRFPGGVRGGARGSHLLQARGEGLWKAR